MRDVVGITILGCDESVWPVAGRYAGTEGVIISEEGIDGILDAPVKVIDDSTPMQVGGTLRGVDYEVRDIVLRFYAFEDEARGLIAGGHLESRLRKAFCHEPDRWNPDFKPTRIKVVTRLSGVRTIEVWLNEAPNVDLTVDPLNDEMFIVAYQLRAYQPMWRSRPDMTFFESTGASGTGTIEVWNPTDRPLLQRWELTRGTWTLPDPTWSGKPNHRAPGGAMPTRAVELPQITAADGGVTIQMDRSKQHARSATGTPYEARMQGNWLRHVIPPYTPRQGLPISVVGAPVATGARAELHMDRLWSRAWGLEWQ
ncbi:hypothetical protein [Prescottella equi]|uniref:hypothetical protein n=1 Tax=Rhodococcus hoagii TaxID=43767 RepID=UPI000A119112|nr:hypothetical protein [Prescottella equi]ORL83896.1 hypothetical protein A5N71_01240 [Prescottella equi]